MALHLEQFEDDGLLVLAERSNRVNGEKTLYVFSRAIVDDADIIIARGPGMLEQRPASLFEGLRQRVAQPVQRVAQGRAPLLIPVRMAARVAAAVAPPAIEAVKAAP